MDFSHLLTVGFGITVSISTIYVGSHVDILEEKERNSSCDGNGAPQLTTVQHQVTLLQALSYPIYASISLLTLFLFFDYLQYILVLSIIFSATYSSYAVLFSFTQNYPQFSFHQVNYTHICCFCLSIIITLEWIRSGSIFCHDILGCALCILFISVLRFPSLKIAAITLSLLVLYDIFWVFFSEYFFSKNVMVEVATRNASNPVQDVGEYLNIDFLKRTTETINLPIKLIFPNFFNPELRGMMLGLGDIALPGGLIALARRADVAFALETSSKRIDDLEAQRLESFAQKSYLFLSSMTGYLLGLFAAFAGSILSGRAQPALIYIVPAVLIALSSRAYVIGRFNEIWSGMYKACEN